MIPMPNSGLADPVNWGLGMGLARVPRSRCVRWATGWLAAGLGNKREKHPVFVQSLRQLSIAWQNESLLSTGRQSLMRSGS
jgi:hypothetical protein